jgi:esterase
MPALSYVLVANEKAPPSRWMVFLHGILGSGSNWRTFANKLIAARPNWGVALVDLRMHGLSQGFGPPHTIAACAADVLAIEPEIPGPIEALLGHSFGGKVALEMLRSPNNVHNAWILDSTPSARPDARGSESTVKIVSLLERLPLRFPTRDSFIQEVMNAGNDRAIAMWLAMQVKPAAEGDGYEWRLDLPAIRALLDDYFMRDEWSAIEATRAKVHIVIGGKSSVLDQADRARAMRLSEMSPSRVSVDILPNAGHWVHVDAPNELLELVLRGTPQ